MKISSEMAKKAKCFADFSVLCILIPQRLSYVFCRTAQNTVADLIVSVSRKHFWSCSHRHARIISFLTSAMTEALRYAAACVVQWVSIVTFPVRCNKIAYGNFMGFCIVILR